MAVIVGWDIGGAHLKAARAENGRISDALQIPSPLRLGLGALLQAFKQARERMSGADRHVCTMTGELADTFASRAEGVQSLTEIAARELQPERVLIYAGRAGLVPPEAASSHVDDIASANWHATAAFAAKQKRNALLIDVGSTTTDIIPIVGGTVAARAYTDAERLQAGELVYTGLVRTSLMGVVDRAPVDGRWIPLVREHFATTADVYRVLGSLPEAADQMSTADGREKTLDASTVRLARMVGKDAVIREARDSLAHWFAEEQLRTVLDAAMLVLSRGEIDRNAPVLGAGIGVRLVSELARRVGRSYVGFDTLLDAAPAVREWASHCAPAAALALLGSAL
jgi:(4-(4-[2-(gamma-L-glutamylamino)ethyl]phenoxymethyl)furan-2-yl)methanamine synthase